MADYIQRDGVKVLFKQHLDRGRELGKLVRALPTGYAQMHALQAFKDHHALGKTLTRKHIVDKFCTADVGERERAKVTEYAYNVLCMRNAPNDALKTDPFSDPMTTTELASDDAGSFEVDSHLLKRADLAVDNMLGKNADVL